MIASPAIQSIVSRSLGPSQQGMGLGVLASVSGICAALGPLLFSALYSYCRHPPLSFPELPFYIGAGLVSVGIVVVQVWLPLGRDLEHAAPLLDEEVAWGDGSVCVQEEDGIRGQRGQEEDGIRGQRGQEEPAPPMGSIWGGARRSDAALEAQEQQQQEASGALGALGHPDRQTRGGRPFKSPQVPPPQD